MPKQILFVIEVVENSTSCDFCFTFYIRKTNSIISLARKSLKLSLSIDSLFFVSFLSILIE